MGYVSYYNKWFIALSMDGIDFSDRKPNSFSR
jgi:hypothetical protein